MLTRERERHRERDRERDRERERETTERQRQRQRKRQTERQRERDRDRERNTEDPSIRSCEKRVRRDMKPLREAWRSCTRDNMETGETFTMYSVRLLTGSH